MVLVVILGNAVDFGIYEYRSMQVQEAAQVGAADRMGRLQRSGDASDDPELFRSERRALDGHSKHLAEQWRSAGVGC